LSSTTFGSGVTRSPALLAMLALAVSAASAGTEPLTTSEKQEFNYAFATQIGSGIYTISGRTLQIYSLPLSATLRATEDSRRGWRFTFPMTFGFVDFKAQDVLDNNLPESVSTFSLVPGVEFLLPVREHWLLKPFAEAGYVWDRSGNADAAVYSAGLWSRADFKAGGFDLILGNGLNYALVDPTSIAGRDSMVVLETAFSAGHLFGSASRGNADYQPYLVSRVYFGGVDAPLQGEGSVTLAECEVGMTFGTRGPVKVWNVPLPRVGVGYVFGHDLSVVRVVFGLPARSLKP
jgi:hypothetical protein